MWFDLKKNQSSIERLKDATYVSEKENNSMLSHYNQHCVNF